MTCFFLKLLACIELTWFDKKPFDHQQHPVTQGLREFGHCCGDVWLEERGWKTHRPPMSPLGPS